MYIYIYIYYIYIYTYICIYIYIYIAYITIYKIYIQFITIYVTYIHNILDIYIYVYIYNFQYIIYILYTTIHATVEEGGRHFFTPFYHFHLFHRHLDISWAITAESFLCIKPVTGLEPATYGFRAQVANTKLSALTLYHPNLKIKAPF